MDNIEVIDQVGKGMFNTVFLVKSDNNLFALRRQKIIYSEATSNDPRFSIVRELSFYKWIDDLSVDDSIHFMKMYRYKIYECNFVHEPRIAIPQHEIDLHNKLKKSPHCIDMLVELKDGMLFKLILKKSLTTSQRYSITIQVLYALYLMHRDGYYHGDSHIGNIAYTSCNNDRMIKYTIGDRTYELKSYGYIISFIDYGLVMDTDYVKGNNPYYMIFNIDLANQIGLLMNAPLIFAKNKGKFPQREKLLNVIYTDFKGTYEKMKDILLLLVKGTLLVDELHEIFNNYEGHVIDELGLLAKLDSMGITTFWLNIFVIYKKDIFCKLLSIAYVPNFIDNIDIDYILTNMHNGQYILEHLLKEPHIKN